MDIIFKGRRTDVPERFRRYAEAKLGKLERLDRKAIRVDVEVSTERNPRQADRRQRVELTIASRGPVIRAEAAADDRYAALDRACAKLEERLRRSGDRRKARYGAAGTERVPEPRVAADGTGQARPRPAAAPGSAAERAAEEQAAAEQAAEERAAEAAREMLALASAGLGGDDIVPIAMEGDGPLVVREKFHAATPMSIDQALFQMELVGHDFFLFRDAERGHPSVVYRRHGYQYGVIRLVEGEARSGPIQPGARAGRGSTGGQGIAAAGPGAGLPGPGGLGR
jgi:ribosomal subunit interface protein